MQITTQLATHSAFSRTKSDPQNPITQVDRGTDSSRPSNLNNYNNNPYLVHPHSHSSFSPHMTQSAMANFPFQITQVDHGMHSSRPSNLNPYNNSPSSYLEYGPYSNPSSSAYMKLPAMANFQSQWIFAEPTAHTDPHGLYRVWDSTLRARLPEIRQLMDI